LPQWHILFAVIIPWVIITGLLIWSFVAMSHFQKMERSERLWNISPARHAYYERYGSNIQFAVGAFAFVALPVFYTIVLVRRRVPYSWLVLLCLIISEILSFIVLVGGLMSWEDVLYP